MELIARFELATSSLPKFNNPFFRVVSFCLLSARTVYYQRLPAFTVRLVSSRAIPLFDGVFGDVMGF